MSPAPRLPGFAPDWALFLDVDGTLLELAERPDAVRVGAAEVALLRALQRAAGGALALVSGRPVADLDALFAPLALPAAGQHGVERRDAAGAVHRHAPSQALRREAARLHEFAARHRGLILEDKGNSLALHFRLAPQFGAAAGAALAEAAAALGEGFELLRGKMVVELKPSGRDKGMAITEFMREAPFTGRRPVFVGDDHTDEHGFAVVNRLGGESIKVGAGESVARWRIADARAVRAWLAQWAASVGAGQDV